MKTANQTPMLPSLAVLRCFEAAARRESFTLAAEELHLTQSAVSRQVRELEQTLGFPLFRRVGRRVVLNDAGRRFAEQLGTDLERLRQTVYQTIAAGDQRRALRIASLPTFANRWLIPRLERFEAANPDIVVSIGTRLKPFDFHRERFDLAIHFGSEDWPDTRMVHLCDEEVVAVAAPEFVERHGLSEPSDLASAPLLHLDSRPQAWREWFRAAGVTDEPALRGKWFDQFSMIITAAVGALGTGLLPAYLIEEELHSGRLVRISDTVLRTDKAYYVVTPAGVPDDLCRRFIDWIRTEVSPITAA
ncbi:MAG: LysR substrate-binding domain-containing protein [Halofilum sp. (in: g-proteobacteria)]